MVMKSGQLQVARVGRERGRGDLQGHRLPAQPAFFPVSKCKEETSMEMRWGEAGGLASPVREHYKVTRTVKKKNVELVQILLKRRSLLKKVFTMSKKRKLKP